MNGGALDYASYTRQDRNPFKRYVQNRRLDDALRLFAEECSGAPAAALDFGAGDGEISKRIALKYPSTKVVCYEPAQSLRTEAERNLAGVANALVIGNLSGISSGSYDAIVCTEVFEHLPPPQTQEALAVIHALLKPGGVGIIGVPVEIFLPALVKGCFRMARRAGDYDARFDNILRVTFGVVPSLDARPRIEFAPGVPYHSHHLGFDHRRLRADLLRRFVPRREICSPFGGFGSWCNSEIYFIIEKSPSAKE